MRPLKFPIPLSILLFLAFVLAGTYYLRLQILERHLAAAMEGDDEASVLELVDSFPCPLSARDKDGRTVLHWAAGKGRRDLVERYLARGADMRAKDTEGRSALQHAALNGNKETVVFLVDKGAEVDAKDTNGQTPLHWGAGGGNKDVVEFLVGRGADVNARDSSTRLTPLHQAAISGSAETAELLVAGGADVNAKTRFGGLTPLHYAAGLGYKEIVKLLVAKGADVNARDSDGQTPLAHAKSPDYAFVNSIRDLPRMQREQELNRMIADQKEAAEFLRGHRAKE